jgi:methionine synthase (B12-dependent) (EC 2.1.1.13)
MALSPAEKVRRSILDGNREDIAAVIETALHAGIAPEPLVHDIMIPAMSEVGDLFDKKEYFLPQLIASAETMKIAFGRLEPLLRSDSAPKIRERVVILATVQGDIHDIGKNIVALMLRNHGFSVVDLGKDVAAAAILDEIKNISVRWSGCRR